MVYRFEVVFNHMKSICFAGEGHINSLLKPLSDGGIDLFRLISGSYHYYYLAILWRKMIQLTQQLSFCSS